VELQGVTKRFGDLAAVRRLDLSFRRGEFFTLLGPSGCGKTTTLRMVAGFERPSKGRIPDRGSTVTFPLYVWGAARVAVPPQINIIATMIFFATLVLMALTVLQQRRAERMASGRPEEA
jgi:ABC-type Fe3+/spermidine/putrescine transport system ATPase subunit